MATLEDLEKRVSKLEKGDDDLDLPKVPLFGKVFATVGNKFSDLVLRTKGDIKIQWGNKYIPLIKDGKLAVENKFIYSTDKVGKKDGIYVVNSGDSQSIILVSGGNEFTLGGDSSEGVSYTVVQEKTIEERSTAQQNVGLISNSIGELGISTGVTYSIADNKLYTVLNGELYSPTAELPNPLTKQLVIQTNDGSTGSLVIRGDREDKGIILNNTKLYEESARFHVSTDSYIHGNLFIGGDSGTIPTDGVGIILGDATIYNWKATLNLIAGNGVYIRDVLYVGQNPTTQLREDKVQTDLVQANTIRPLDRSFSLTTQDGYSTLTVDNIIEEDPIICDNIAYPDWFFNINNTIKSYRCDTNSLKFYISLYFKNEFNTGDIVRVFFIKESQPLEVQEVYFTIETFEGTEMVMSVNTNIKLGGSYFVENPFIPALDLQGKQIQLVYRENTKLFKYDRRSISWASTSDVDLSETVSTKIGFISDDDIGVYSDNANFKVAKYTSDYNLPVTDNSTNLASTEWFHKALPKGSIIMFNGSVIPEGWHICDGNDGTPNLIDKFIKGTSLGNVGDTGGSTEITLTIENLPEHTHTFNVLEANTAGSGNYLISPDASEAIESSTTGSGEPINIEPTYYSLIYIIKIV